MSKETRKSEAYIEGQIETMNKVEEACLDRVKTLEEEIAREYPNGAIDAKGVFKSGQIEAFRLVASMMHNEDELLYQLFC